MSERNVWCLSSKCQLRCELKLRRTKTIIEMARRSVAIFYTQSQWLALKLLKYTCLICDGYNAFISTVIRYSKGDQRSSPFQSITVLCHLFLCIFSFMSLKTTDWFLVQAIEASLSVIVIIMKLNWQSWQWSSSLLMSSNKKLCNDCH